MLHDFCWKVLFCCSAASAPSGLHGCSRLTMLRCLDRTPALLCAGHCISSKARPHSQHGCKGGKGTCIADIQSSYSQGCAGCQHWLQMGDLCWRVSQRVNNFTRREALAGCLGEAKT